MLESTPEEKETVTEYFISQAPDLEITFLQKVYSESVIGHRHDVWDIHTNVDRWWVITNPTNLYSQEQFPNMDIAVTFHMGLCLRIPQTQKQRRSSRRVRPFGEVLVNCERVQTALGQAQHISDYQAIGMRCRELLLEFIYAAQESQEWGGATDLKRADFRAWTEIICDTIRSGSGQKDRRRLIKSLLNESWTFTNWLTHSKSATWHDAEAALSTVGHALSLSISLVIRHNRSVPDVCPSCGSRNLYPEEGRHTGDLDVVWERPHCDDCDWTGVELPVDIEPLDDEEIAGLITRESLVESDDKCSIQTVPVRNLRMPDQS
ncbi:hypothetical protein FHS21_004518 [Phyllobacterium trifolii]|uniref:Gamma-glutamylcyclotransferase n=1 Tax=Phyllobacterium trifolii TaxID=300193 RepID=A0A839UC12_9HYPH|nr:hypothetical protein [Phyllobacterium trifolii]MBB3148077.1 hypothetical protein [Phyllobacterium trifolii]